MFSLTFATDSDAFREDPAAEVARILEDVGRRLIAGAPTMLSGACRDVNGDTVGSYILDVERKGTVRQPPTGR